MWFWMVNNLWWPKKDLLWDIRLCSPIDFIGSVVWLYCGFVVFRSPCLWTASRSGSFLSYKSKIDNEKDNECTKLNYQRYKRPMWNIPAIYLKQLSISLMIWSARTQNRGCHVIRFWPIDSLSVLNRKIW